MTMRWLGVAMVGLAVTVGVAQDGGSWRAASSNARAITGDVSVAGDRIYINFERYTIAEIRALTQPEMGALFGEESGAGVGKLYRVSIPGGKKFLHKNTLCGSDETQWVATFAAGKTLQVAFFSGSSIPVLTAEAVANSGSLCGTYTYLR
jgi:hypothetical protein